MKPALLVCRRSLRKPWRSCASTRGVLVANAPDVLTETV
jgi:hypothetical protein